MLLHFPEKNVIVNTGNIIDAQYSEKGNKAMLILRYPCMHEGKLHRMVFKDSLATSIWSKLQEESEDVIYFPDK
jgi:hypothetical protein